ncbi:MAG TPA: hypothetical protein VN950_23485 [Terriglobales bacterium]|nr:hypothetical protein [Terriglobales bacterium]
MHTRYQQIAGPGDRRIDRASVRARGRRGALVLRGVGRAGASGDRGHRAYALVRAPAGQTGHDLWIADATKIRASVVRKQKADTRDAAHLLDLLLSQRFPRIWRPSLGERDLRQLLWHAGRFV